MRLKSEKDVYLLLFEISHALFLSYSLLGHVESFHLPLKIATVFSIILFILNFFLQNRIIRISTLLGYVALLGLSLVHAGYSRDYAFFKLMLFASAIRKVDFKRIIRFDMYLRVWLITLVIILCNINIVPDVVITYDGIVRRSLGFTNPNTLGTAVFVLICDILYVNNLRITPKTILLVSVISVWLYTVARCRTAAYAIVCLVLIVVLYNFDKKQLFTSRGGSGIIYALPILLSWLTAYSTNQYAKGKHTFVELNILLSGRLQVIEQFCKKLRPTLFGQPVSQVIDKSLDNAYAFIFLDLGIVVSILLYVAYVWMIRRNLKTNPKLCVIMIVFLIYGLSEHLWINVDYNIFMLAFLANPSDERTMEQRILDSKYYHGQSVSDSTGFYAR